MQYSALHRTAHVICDSTNDLYFYIFVYRYMFVKYKDLCATSGSVKERIPPQTSTVLNMF